MLLLCMGETLKKNCVLVYLVSLLKKKNSALKIKVGKIF